MKCVCCKGIGTAILLGWVALGPAATAQAGSTYSFSSGSRSASATFDLVNPTTLTMTLSNTSTADTLVPTDVLTAIFFRIQGAPNFGKTSAVLAPGSLVYYDSDGQPAGGIVGGEWAYKRGLDVEIGHGRDEEEYNEGISSSGLDIFGSGNRFPGPNLAGPTSPNGLQYGLLTAGDNLATGNGGITGSGGLIKNSVIFTLQVYDGFSLRQLGHSVGFQYGTDLCEPSFNGRLVPDCNPAAVPEPSSVILVALGATGVMGLRFLRRPRMG